MLMDRNYAKIFLKMTFLQGLWTLFSKQSFYVYNFYMWWHNCVKGTLYDWITIELLFYLTWTCLTRLKLTIMYILLWNLPRWRFPSRKTASMGSGLYKSRKIEVYFSLFILMRETFDACERAAPRFCSGKRVSEFCRVKVVNFSYP